MTARTYKVPRIFYTYLWLREDGTPYYVGKGVWNCHPERAYRRGCPPHDRIITQDHESEDDAFYAEMFLIGFYGRKNIGTGCLINLTDGGEGTRGAVCSEEKKRLLSEQRKGKPNLKLRGRKRSDELRSKLSEYRKLNPIKGYDPIIHSERMSGSGNPWFGKKREFNDEWRKKLSDGRRAHIVSEETRKKMSESARKRWQADSKQPDCCHRGHPYTPENTWIGKSGSRFCLECRKINHEALNQRRRELREATR
jgi:hypothetical protein